MTTLKAGQLRCWSTTVHPARVGKLFILINEVGFTQMGFDYMKLETGEIFWMGSDQILKESELVSNVQE